MKSSSLCRGAVVVYIYRALGWVMVWPSAKSWKMTCCRTQGRRVFFLS